VDSATMVIAQRARPARR